MLELRTRNDQRVEPVLLTERLALRQFTKDDASRISELDGDPAVMRFLDSRIKSLADIEREVLPKFLAEYSRYRDFGHWAAEMRDDGAFVGWFSLRPVVPAPDAMIFWPDGPGDARTVELGYRLVRTAWGCGYATEGALALVRRVCTELDADEVVANTMAVNTGSRRVMEKAGLRYTRTLHLDWAEPLPGNEHGDVEYQIGRAEWTEARG